MQVSLVGITNDVKFVDMLDARVRSSLGEEELVFRPYNAEQLEDILRERAEKAFHPGVLEPGVIEYCAALAARVHGDARRALDLLRVAGELAEREGASSVSVEHVKRAWDVIERDRVFEVIRSLPLQARIVLLSLVLLRWRGVKSTTTGELYNAYSLVAERIGIDPVTQRRVSDIINELDMLGVINARIVSRGRYGKTRIITLSADPDTVVEALSVDPLLGRVLRRLRGRG